MANSPQTPEASNPFQKTGLTSELVKIVGETAGAEGLRRLVGDIHRSTARILHPDAAGGAPTQAGTEFLDAQTQATNLLRGFDGPAVQTFAKAYALSRQGRARAASRTSGKELVDAEYIRNGRLIHDMVTMALETQVSVPSASDKHIWLRPSVATETNYPTLYRLSSGQPVSFRTAHYDSLTSELDSERLKSAEKIEASKKIMGRKIRVLNNFLASNPQPSKFLPGKGTWLQKALGEKTTDDFKPELFMSIGEFTLSLADYHDGSFICEFDLTSANGLRQELPNGHYTITRGSMTKDLSGRPLRFGLFESYFNLDTAPQVPSDQIVIGSVHPAFIKGEIASYAQTGNRLAALPANLTRSHTALPAVPVPAQRYAKLEGHFTPLIKTGYDLAGVAQDGSVQLLGNITAISAIR